MVVVVVVVVVVVCVVVVVVCGGGGGARWVSIGIPELLASAMGLLRNRCKREGAILRVVDVRARRCML